MVADYSLATAKAEEEAKWHDRVRAQAAERDA
jgi:hypothetical protein